MEFPVETPVYTSDFSEKEADKEEVFKGKHFFYLINANQSNKRVMAPINRKQTTLIKFLPGIKINRLITHKTPSKPSSGHLPYTL